jgi:hypothetical protein
LTQVPIDVFPIVPATVDFLKVGLDNQLGWTVPAPFRLDGALDDIATYRFKIVIVGNDLQRMSLSKSIGQANGIPSPVGKCMKSNYRIIPRQYKERVDGFRFSPYLPKATSLISSGKCRRR